MLCNSSPETREHEKRRPVYQTPALKLRDQYIAMTSPPPTRGAAGTATIRIP